MPLKRLQHLSRAIASVEMDSLNVPNNDDKCDSNIDNLTMSRRRCARLTNEEQWRVILSQKETREARKSVKRKKAQNDEDEDKPTKVFKSYENRAKKTEALKMMFSDCLFF